MAHIFAVFLALSTFSAGVIWCIHRVKIVQYRCRINRKGQRKGIQTIRGREKDGWIENIASVFPVLLIVFIVRSFIFEPFHIPSGSMIPTLLIGDFILVEKYAYGLRDPITNTILVNTGNPQRGDIVVFQYPKNRRQDYIKRVIGLPGDRVDYNPITKTLSILSSCDNHQNCNSSIPVIYSNVRKYNQILTGFSSNTSDNMLDKSLLNDSSLEESHVGICNETIGHVSHNIVLSDWEQSNLRSIYQGSEAVTRSWLVPDNMYFVMGDNRDNSSDSRIWGFVSEDHLIGKAVVIWMSMDKQEGKWPTGLTFSRTGIIQ
ncbi:signal peptidase I [Candidatus Erwinia haradaeae]|uniref:Signal peptidase I n=1 Tax=Candidatus Erwinia haradaeae TaxID=1922217 RepID=A0A803GC39_9GAMM|nr:signal peptidase I [Candidatus Erwinia haradaeae]VFP87267.1 Signal peptidase I [Candidatus Erwinia haradaeae]